VNDIIITGTTISEIQVLISMFRPKFALKDLRDCTIFLE